MPNTIRKATANDAEGVAQVHVDTWKDAYRGIVPDDYLNALNVEARLKAYERFGILTDSTRPLFVSVEEGAVVGFTGVGPSNEDPDVGEVYSIYVVSARWGSTVGHELMTRAERWLSERFSVATLWVLDGNVRARRFYERRGWIADGTTKEDDRGSFTLKEIRYRLTLRPA